MNASRTDDSGLWQVDDLIVDSRARTVQRNSQTLDLPRLSLDFLITLIEAAPGPVSGDELMDRVWRGAVVSPATVAKRAELLRQSLGDDSAKPRYVALERGYGYRLIPEPKPLSSSAPSASGAAGKSRFWLLGLAVLVLAIGLSYLYPESEPAPASPLERSIAVLPFTSLGEDPADQLFADGLTVELGHVLSQSGTVRVTGRKSTSQFRGSDEDPATIGDALGVAYLLEGTVRRSGEQLRVVATLTDTSAGVQRWSDAYDREMSDVIDIQQDIARNVAAQLQLRFNDAPRRPTENPEAYTLFLKAESLMEYPFGADLPGAQDLLEQAVNLDPDFSRAWTYLASAHLRRQIWNEPSYTLSPEQSLAAIRDAVDRALAAAPEDGMAFAVLAAIAWSIEDDMAKAVRLTERHAELTQWWNAPDTLMFAADVSRSLRLFDQALTIQSRVLELDPLCNYCRNTHVLTLNAAGRFREAMEHATLLIQTRPESNLPAYHLGLSQLYAGEFDAAVETFMDIDNPLLRPTGLAMAYHSLGMTTESDREWAALQETIEAYGPTLQLAYAAAWTGREEEAFAVLDHWVDPPNLRISIQTSYTTPAFDNLRGGYRWTGFEERIGRSPSQLDGISFSLPIPGDGEVTRYR